MTTLPLDALTAGLAAGTTHAPYGTAAAVRLLIAHDRWLHRADFLDALVQSEHEHCRPPAAWVHWHAVPAFLEHAPCSTSEARILRLAASLAGYHCAHPHCACPPLGDLLSGLDDTNAQLVADALGHVLARAGGRPVTVPAGPVGEVGR